MHNHGKYGEVVRIADSSEAIQEGTLLDIVECLLRILK